MARGLLTRRLIGQRRLRRAVLGRQPIRRRSAAVGVLLQLVSGASSRRAPGISRRHVRARSQPRQIPALLAADPTVSAYTPEVQDEWVEPAVPEAESDLIHRADAVELEEAGEATLPEEATVEPDASASVSASSSAAVAASVPSSVAREEAERAPTPSVSRQASSAQEEASPPVHTREPASSRQANAPSLGEAERVVAPAAPVSATDVSQARPRMAAEALDAPVTVPTESAAPLEATVEAAPTPSDPAAETSPSTPSVGRPQVSEAAKASVEQPAPLPTAAPAPSTVVEHIAPRGPRPTRPPRTVPQAAAPSAATETEPAAPVSPPLPTTEATRPVAVSVPPTLLATEESTGDAPAAEPVSTSQQTVVVEERTETPSVVPAAHEQPTATASTGESPLARETDPPVATKPVPSNPDISPSASVTATPAAEEVALTAPSSPAPTAPDREPQSADELFLPNQDQNRSPQSWLERLRAVVRAERGEAPEPAPTPEAPAAVVPPAAPTRPSPLADPLAEAPVGNQAKPAPRNVPAEAVPGRPATPPSVRRPLAPVSRPSAPPRTDATAGATPAPSAPQAPPPPLSESTRRFLRPLVGVDPAEVRVQRDAAAARITEAAGVDALAVGETVLLSSEHSEDTPATLGLLAHELTHVARARQPRYVPPASRSTVSSPSAPPPVADVEESMALQAETQVTRQAYAEREPLRQSAAPTPTRPAQRVSPLPASEGQPSGPLHPAPAHAGEPVTVPAARRFTPALPADSQELEAEPQASSPASPATPSSPSSRGSWGGLPAPWEPLPEWLTQPIAAPSASAGISAAPGPDSPAELFATAHAAEADRSTEPGQGGDGDAPATPTGAGAPPDLDALARQVYSILRRRLAAERRRAS